MLQKQVIIGINYGSGHDSSSAILVNGKLIAIGEEERFTRVKHDISFPWKSIEFCLKEAGLKPVDVTHVCIGWDKDVHAGKRYSFLFRDFTISGLRRRFSFLRVLRNAAIIGVANAKQLFPNAKVTTVEHHLAHIASCYFTSPFEESAVISWDGRGEWSTGMLAHAKGNQVAALRTSYYPSSFGMLYTAFTHYLGFDSNDEYKVMGLSAYGRLSYVEKIRQVVKFSPEHIYDIDLSYIQHPGINPNMGYGREYYSAKLETLLGPARRKGEPINKHYEDVAASLQQVFNEIGVQIAQYLRGLTGSENLCITGGVGLNGVMNMAIIKNAGFKNYHFIPAPDDAGVALGAALWVHNHIQNNVDRVPLSVPYWGIHFSNDEIRKEIETYRFKNVVELDDPAKTAAELLAMGKIIGWFQGRGEFGPRALGCRSILGDPRPAEFKDVVNARIKFREEFRPFAPSVLYDHASAYFDLPDESPYMLQICSVKKDKRSIIQAVTHVNGSARPQTVRPDVNPLYYSLIENFYKITGIPLVLNTSFNVKGEPIVNAPADAIRCFYATGLDYLIVGKFLFHKNLSSDYLA